MSEDVLRAEDYVSHIIQAASRIETYTAHLTEGGFLESNITQDAVIRNFEVIGEASRNLIQHCPEFAAAHPHLPLLDAYGMRNVLTHGYFKVDLEIVWKTIREDLPELRRQMEGVVFNVAVSGSEADAEAGKTRKAGEERPQDEGPEDDLGL
jgi:uncharacterized protein with HEPN domain